MQNDFLLGLVIRPPRSSYPDDAGMTETQNIAGSQCTIENFTLLNAKGQKLHCCYITQANMPEDTKRPCVIYMHGNAGNKLEGKSMA